MPFFLSREAVRELDRRAIHDYGVPGVVLMENAGRGVAEWLLRLNVERQPVAIVCGRGNNGGDGFVIARHLDLAGIAVRLLDFSGDGGSPESDSVIHRTIAQRSGLPFALPPDNDLNSWCAEAFSREGWIVDALFGTGLSRPVGEPYATVIRALNASQRPILAVDVPSGLDCDSGFPLGDCVQASYTATFVAQKLGFQSPAAANYLGEVSIIDIGAPRVLLEDCLRGGTWIA